MSTAEDVSDHRGNPGREYNPETSDLRVLQVVASGTAMRTSVREPARSPQDAVPCNRLPEDSFSRGMAGGKAWLAALIFLLAITVAGLPVTLAAGPEIRSGAKPAAGQPPLAGPQQNSAQQVSARKQAQPRKPAKIKLQRNAKGDYTWDLTGENVDELLQIDRRLRKAFVPQEEVGAGR